MNNQPVVDKEGKVIKGGFRFNGQYVNPKRQAKKALRKRYHCSGKRLVALQKRHRRVLGTELA